jgi:hypothetical protein
MLRNADFPHKLVGVLFAALVLCLLVTKRVLIRLVSGQIGKPWGTSEIRYLEFAPSLCESALCYLWFKCPYCYCSFSASWSTKKGRDSRKPNEGGVKARKLEGTLCTFGAKELP